MPRVLVNTVSLRGGALTREVEILRALRGVDSDLQYDVLLDPSTASNLGSVPEWFTLHEVDRPDGTAGRLRWENTALLGHVRRLSPDVLYFPLHSTNLVDRCPKVAAVRNAAPFYPEAHVGASVGTRARLRALRLATRLTVRQSAAVVFMTRATLERVAEYVPAASEKGVVVPHGLPRGFEPRATDPGVADRYDLPERFLLSVSNVTRYKNLVELVEGYARAAERCDLPPLCLAGKVIDEAYHRSVRARIAENGVEDDVRLLGFVDHDDLPALHAASEFFVFSSACENAPLSLVEALACGSPVASSNAASMPELCGDAAVYFDPYDPDEIADALEGLWTDADLRSRLSQAALERAATFDWTTAAAEIDKVLHRVATEDNV